MRVLIAMTKMIKLRFQYKIFEYMTFYKVNSMQEWVEKNDMEQRKIWYHF